jgi:ADP-heptose:LPS heptosyltransferase
VDIKRILLIRTDRFGEFILNTPVIRAIKEKFPSSYLGIMVNPMVKGIVEGSPYIDEILIYDEKAMQGFFKSLKFVSEIRKKKFDLVVILNPKKKFNIITFLAGIPIRLGYNRKWGFLLTHKIEDRKSSGQKHEVEYNLDLVRRIRIDTQDKSLFISVDKEDEQFIDSLLNGLGIINTDLLVTLHPWTSDPVKQWPVENFLQLASRLSRELPYKVIIIGGKDQISQSVKFCQENPDIINLTAKLTLGQSAALLKKCRLLISNDSGPVHLACAVGTLVIALFRNDIPAKSAKRWGPWGEGHIVIEKSNLADITVDEVLVKIKEMLNR